MPCVPTRTALASLAEVVVVLSLAAGPAQADSYNFTNEDYAAAVHNLRLAAVRIFGSHSGGDQIGAGFVIDSNDGLILSAAHVVRDLQGSAWVAFPRDNDRHHAKILLPKSADSRSAAGARDLSILQLDPAVNGVGALEVQFDEIEGGKKHHITGFGRSNVEPIPADAIPAGTADPCIYTLRDVTLQGDSGSALMTEEGLVDGIAVSGAESLGTGAMFQMMVLPLSCVRDEILGAVSGGESSEIMATIWKGDDRARLIAFQPPPNITGWVSNLRLAKALMDWITAHNASRHPTGVDEKRWEDVFRIIAQRRLGYAMIGKFAFAEAAGQKAAADVLHQLGDEEIARGSTARAMTAYMQAQTFYSRYADSQTPTIWMIGSGPVAPNYDVAETYKAAADNMTKLAGLTGKKEDLNVATSLAATAVLFAPTGQLKASSWAILGAASHDAGDFEIAVPAYRAAIEEGANEPWISKGLTEAKSALGAKPEVNLTVQYLENQAQKAAPCSIKNPC